MSTQDQQTAAQRTLFARKLGGELRLLREASGLSLAQVAEIFDWGRDSMSKIERGERPIATFEYLRLLWFYRDLDPDHPGVTLARRLLSPATRGERS